MAVMISASMLHCIRDIYLQFIGLCTLLTLLFPCYQDYGKAVRYETYLIDSIDNGSGIIAR